jgi:hypothetical protein
MKICLLLLLLLTGCTTSMGPPPHPIAGATWTGTKTLVLGTTEYTYELESGAWTADSKEFRYKREGRAQERCGMTIAGRTLVLTGCRLADRYTRQD